MTIDHDLLAAYERLAARYDATRDAFDITAPLAAFRARLPARGTLIDLGCGAGVPVAQTFLAQGWQVVGVDFCPRMLMLAGQQVPALQRVRADLRQVAFAPQCCEAVTAVYSLFHVPAADHPALFAAVRDWLKPGGWLWFTYATQEYTGQPRFNGHIEFLGERLFYSHVTPEELGAQLMASGLTLVAQELLEIGGERFLWVTARR